MFRGFCGTRDKNNHEYSKRNILEKTAYVTLRMQDMIQNKKQIETVHFGR